MPDRGARPQTLAARVLLEVRSGRSLGDALPPALAAAPPSTRALLQALCYGTLRHGESLAFLRDGLLKHPLPARQAAVEALLAVALFQIQHGHSGVHRVVNDSVAAARELGQPRLAGLVNAVLRRFLRERETRLEALNRAPAPTRLDLPAWIHDRLAADWKDAAPIAEALRAHPPMTLRVDTGRIDRAEWMQRAETAGLEPVAGQHAATAVTLRTAVDTARLPGFDQGLVSVQDEAAQLVVPLMDLAPGHRVLDACAAPGGKTLAMLEQVSGLEMTAVDISASRLEQVRENLERGDRQARLVTADAARPGPDWAAAGFDRILLDAPCSASGVIRRHPDIKTLRRPEDIDALAKTQADMLDRLWSLLAPGGRLVYATCSIFRQENDRQVVAFLARQPQARALGIEASWGRACPPGRQILPGEDGMDGFFYAVLCKS